MPYVAPNSTVKLLAGVPIDTDYNHTLWFANVNAQTTYFNSKAIRSFSAVSYVRKGRGYIKLECPADQLYACNYMMYQNTSYSNKWFYAFCSVEYISDTTCAVTFQIDLLQTWLFEMQLEQCFIERQHSTVDYPGSNLVPEGLETGDYVYEDNDYDWCHMFTTYDIIVLTSFRAVYSNNQWQFIDSQGAYAWGIYTGLNLRLFRSVETQATVDSLNSFFSAIVSSGKSDGVLAIIMIPHEALQDDGSGELVPAQLSHTIPKITALDTYYYPRNKKLLTYPYCFIEGQNCEGATAVFPQEYFGGQNPNLCQFMITYGISAAPVALCIPINYKGSEYNYPEGLFINNFTQCSYNIDLFKAYLAQSLTVRILNQATDEIAPTVNTGASDLSHVWNNLGKPLVSGNLDAPTTGYQQKEVIPQNAFSNLSASTVRSDAFPAIALGATASPIIGSVTGINSFGIGHAGQLASNIYDSMKELYAKAIQPAHNVGSNTPDYFTANRLKGFWFFHRTIRTEFAEKIDKYFDMFGYAVHNVAVPNIHARERWTYIKTVGAQVAGNIPREAVSLIQNVLNSGITFWADTAHFGDYTQTNNII